MPDSVEVRFRTVRDEREQGLLNELRRGREDNAIEHWDGGAQADQQAETGVVEGECEQQ
jgi:hypothetical protein